MHEKDLENSVNSFLENFEDSDIVDIKYQVSISMFAEEQIYCFSAMIIYKDNWKFYAIINLCFIVYYNRIV